MFATPLRLTAATLITLAALGGEARAEHERVTVGPDTPTEQDDAALRPLAVLISFGVATPPTIEIAVRAHRHVEISAGIASQSMDRPIVMLRGLYPIATGKSWALALHAGLGGGIDAGEDPMSERAFARADAGATIERRGFTVRVSGGVEGVDQTPFAALGVGVAF